MRRAVLLASLVLAGCGNFGQWPRLLTEPGLSPEASRAQLVAWQQQREADEKAAALDQARQIRAEREALQKWMAAHPAEVRAAQSAPFATGCGCCCVNPW
jgi:hypothetical protein